MNGWGSWKTLGWILFGHCFGSSHYIFLFYEETQPAKTAANPLTSLVEETEKKKQVTDWGGKDTESKIVA